MRHLSLLLLIFILAASYAYCQSPRFHHIGAEEGLSQSEVYSILEDSRGFMWFGTVDGLNRYDGYEITVFHARNDDEHAISSGTVRTLAEDGKGRIWIGTDDGLCIYDLNSERIHRISLPMVSDLAVSIHAIQIQGHYLWIGGKNRLFRTRIDIDDLDLIERGIHRITGWESTLQDNYNITSLLANEDGSIWIAASDMIKKIFVGDGSNSAVSLLSVPGEIPAGLKRIAKDIHGQIWIVNQPQGLLRFDPKSGKLSSIEANNPSSKLSSNYCSSVNIDKFGNIWIGTRDNGLNYLPANQVTDPDPVFTSYRADPLVENSLGSNLIYSLYTSRENILWVGTIGNGLSVYSPHQKAFAHYRIPPDGDNYQSNFIRSVYGNEEELYLGTHNDGLFRMDRKTKKFKKLGFGKTPIFHIDSFEEEELMVCKTKGLTVLKRKGNGYKISATLGQNTAFYVVRSQPNIYWLATIGGIERYERAGDDFNLTQILTRKSTLAISHNNTRVLHYDSLQNVLWAGTEGGGLNKIQLDNDHYPISNRVYTKDAAENPLSSNYIRALEAGKNNSLWIGTYEGLNHIQQIGTAQEEVQFFRTEDGLPNNMIELLELDKMDHLWVGTNSGLACLNLGDTTFRVFTKSHGLQALEFSEHTSFELSSGELLIGGVNGVNIFSPNEINNTTLEPNTTLTSFSLFNEPVEVGKEYDEWQILKKSIAITDSISLRPEQNSFSFTFSGLQYPASEKSQYAYQLKGYDDDWIMVDNGNRSANYTNLQSGDYTFQVRSTNADGILEETPKMISIHLQTPWSRTWWAYGIYVLGFMGAVAYFATYSIIRITQKKKIILDREATKKMQELNEMRNRFFVNISHDLRTPLTLISSPVTELMNQTDLAPDVKNRLELVDRNVRRLQNLTEQLLDARKAEMGKLQINPIEGDLVRFIANEVACFQHSATEKSLSLTMETNLLELMMSFDPKAMSKLLLNLIFNAIKFTDEGKVTVRLTKEEDTVLVEVLDTGRGIPEAHLDQIFTRYFQHGDEVNEGYGIGLSHCQELVLAHGGDIGVDLRPQGGCRFYFSLPYVPATASEMKVAIPESQTIAPTLSTQATQNLTKNPALVSNLNTILIVEDNQDMRQYLADAFTGFYNVLRAGNGIDGLMLTQRELPDLVISDVMMPRMNGLEFCKSIKQDISISHIPVILLTALTGDESRYSGIETGADDYVSKPFDLEYLKLRIKNILENRKMLREKFSGPYELNPAEVAVSSLDQEFLTELLAKLEEAIPDSDYSISKLEEEMAMSHTNFYRKVKALTDMSGKELLQSLRMKRAYQLVLDDSGLRISEIAYMVGFTNPKYFSRCFKEAHGMAPSNVRPLVF